MIIVIAIAALSLWGLVATVVELCRDGHHAAHTDWTLVAERDLEQHAVGTSPRRWD